MDNNKHDKHVGKFHSILHWWWNINDAAALEMVWQFLKKLNIE